MPVSAKKIIERIRTKNAPFTREALIEEIVAAKVDRSKTKAGRKKGKKKTSTPREDLIRITETIDALIRFGLLGKTKKSYRAVPGLEVEGKILVNSSGNAMLMTEEGDEVVIYPENLRNASNNDLVRAAIVDYRRGTFFAEVRDITRHEKSERLARVERITRGLVIMASVDTPHVTEFAAERTGTDPAEGDVAVIRVLPERIADRQGCQILRNFVENDERLDAQRVIMKYNIPGPHGDYPELAAITDITDVPASELENRKDYRDLYTITIDGETAKDFDDALSVEKKGFSTVLYVHIADVSAYVRQGSELDREATKRGTSFYLGDTVVPMLPEKLSNELCSLKAGVDRLTLSVEMTINKSGVTTGYEFHRGLIRVDQRCTYKDSYAALQEKKNTPLYKHLTQLNDLAKRLKKKRMADGRIDLTLFEQELIYENMIVKDIIHAERLPSHMIIEECMLSANEIVSRALKDRGIPTLYRVHEKMSEEKILALKTFLQRLNLPLQMKGNLGTNIQKVVDGVAGKEYEQVVNMVVLKSLMQAYYGVEPVGHFGLGFVDYTHFTSPIRRYPDLIVHRCLKSLIDRKRHPYGTEDLRLIGEQSSMMERSAQKAEWDLLKIKSCRLMKDRVGETFQALVNGVSKYGIYVALVDKPIDGMVPLRELTDDYYLVQEDNFSVVGKRYGRRFMLGDRIEVRLTRVDIDRLWIDFEVV